MPIKKVLADHPFILLEAAVIEALRRSGRVALHPRLENALLVLSARGRAELAGLYDGFFRVARQAGVPIMVCTPTWRANRKRVAAAGIGEDLNGEAVRFLRGLQAAAAASGDRILVGGLLGCGGDCYRPEESLPTAEAAEFHAWQAERLATAGADYLMAATLPAVREAVGMALALQATGRPYLLSFVIGSDGRILDGTPLPAAFAEIDDATAPRPPLGYLINCAYPSFLHPEALPAAVFERLIGFQANASAREHSELDGSATLQAEAVEDWGERMLALHRDWGLRILGGCCGTDTRHLSYLVTHLADR